MSDFLSNLAARSLGIPEVIRPRVPSLYEPYRRNTGLLGARPSFRSQETNPEPQHETGLVSDGDTAHTDDRITQPRARAPSPPSRGVESAELIPEARPADGFEGPDVERPARLSLSSREGACPDPHAALGISRTKAPTIESNSSSVSPPAVHEPIVRVAITRPDGTGSVLTPPSNTGRIMPEGVRPSKDPEPVDRSAFWHPRQSAEPTPDLSSRRLRPGELAPRGVELPEGSAVYSARSATGVVRPPVGPRSGTVKIPAAVPNTNASEPPIQVTIGRVEVRAIFPEPPARRIPPSRSRPTVSLDDYLKRSNRGQR